MLFLGAKQEHSSSLTAVLTWHILADSAKIGYNSAGRTKSVNGFDRPVGCSKHMNPYEDACSKQRAGSKPQVWVSATELSRNYAI